MTTKTEALVTKTEALDYLLRIRTDPSAWVPSIDAVQDLAITVVALHDGVERLSEERDRLFRLAVDAQFLAPAPIVLTPSEESAVAFAFTKKAEAKADALALELRRLRAAEAPGTDDEALEGTGWRWLMGEWQHQEDPPVWSHNGVWLTRIAGQIVRFSVAIDAMRAAVPGSV